MSKKLPSYKVVKNQIEELRSKVEALEKGKERDRTLKQIGVLLSKVNRINSQHLSKGTYKNIDMDERFSWASEQAEYLIGSFMED